MTLSLIFPKGRLRYLSEKRTKLRAKKKLLLTGMLSMGLLSVMSPTNLMGEEKTPQSKEEIVSMMNAIDLNHARKFGSLLTQDRGGRIKPINTLAHEVLRKISKRNSLYNLAPEQIVLGATIRPNVWQQINMITVTHPEIKTIIGVPPKVTHAAFLDFFDFARPEGYKLASLIDEATRKHPASQNKLDKALLAIDERINICYMLFTGELLRILPKPHDAHSTWFSPLTAIKNFPDNESKKVRTLITRYFQAVETGIKKNDWNQADTALQELATYQKFYGVSIYPSKSKINAEIFYNEYPLFQSLFPLYGIIGLILITLSILHNIKPSLRLKPFHFIAILVLGIGFAIHTFGLGLRWYISEHAPWSNGYESMIYIAWATLLAGFVFARGNSIVLAATGILASVTLFGANLGWMDPQITHLVPVLNSYWLILHVSLITASYGFLGLGACVSFITLLLYAIIQKEEKSRLNDSVSELTCVTEMSLIFGLILLTIGNFLGGIWANESWGRYWGWDPKETWALITILIYAFVLHMRFIPILKQKFAFNVASVLAFFSVLMTYFGVNFYLSGLHSYAKGDPVPIPTWIYIVIITILLTIAFAWNNKRKVGIH
jgi:cytochrome c-type biogenesis protein CcsB